MSRFALWVRAIKVLWWFRWVWRDDTIRPKIVVCFGCGYGVINRPGRGEHCPVCGCAMKKR